MEKITFECETITPMFLAGADGFTPELRAPSIKGALRFWWRALNGHMSVPHLKKREAKIFGGSYQENNKQIMLSSKLKVEILEKNIRIHPYTDLKNSEFIETPRGKMPVLKYITYGMYSFKKDEPDRSFITGTWKLKLSYPKNEENDIIDTIRVFNNFGGLGSKARNGLGSVFINNLTGTFNYKELNNQKTNYTTFNSDTVYKVLEQGHDPMSVLEKLGKRYYEAKKRTHPNFLIAGSDLKGVSDIERYPKTYFFSVKKTETGYDGRVIFLPVLINKDIDKDYVKQHNIFQKELLS